MRFDLECPYCGVSGPHQLDGNEATCQACFVIREVEPELLEAVLDMRFCTWCRETRPAGHTCRPEEPVCESRTHLDYCGICLSCLALQARHYAAREQP